MDTKVAYKRNKILNIISKGTVTTIQGQKEDDRNALKIHDEIIWIKYIKMALPHQKQLS
ncbi:hypothetical protein [Spiroplasma endosymbiont of Polydrusus formosus]|uniref:hypothetical protein n=1 Tax=Spiroplasma endosymbiont of Polydrusus formosus TaxID=3139326 RepID=UPI0035B5314C